MLHRARRVFVFVQALFVLCCLATPSYAGSTVEEINPDFSTQYDMGSPFGASGGRINNLAAAPGNGLVYYAASEWGGLWKTEDGGNTWSHVVGHVPMVAWDVAVDPADASRVYATSLYDGRIRTVAGIQISRDGGQTWFHPLTANPAGLSCVDQNGGAQAAPGEWSGFGVAIQPDAPQNVFAGTTCGVAVSNDAGTSWRFVDPDPNTPGMTYVWDVAVQGGGSSGSAIVDACGPGFHARSTDGGQTWEQHALPYLNYYTGRCSLAVSPDEPYVVFVVDDITDQIAAPPNDFKHQVWESDDAGRTWVRLGKPYPYFPAERTKRLTFLETNDRADDATSLKFDLWYGEQDLWRAECETPLPAAQPPATTDTTIRCPKAIGSGGTVAWTGPPAGGSEEDLGAHGDSGDVVFNPTANVDACPVLYASDGGVFVNKLKASPACQDPTFDQPDESPHTLWLWGMAGSNLSGGGVALHFGVQDDGSWAAPDAHLTPTWADGPTSDSYSRVADPNRYLWNDQAGLHIAPIGTLAGTPVTLPAEVDANGTSVLRTVPEFGFFPKIDQWGDKKYVILTDFIDLDGDKSFLGPDEGQKVFITEDITASPPAWTELTLGLPADAFCGVRAAVDPSNAGRPVFFAVQGRDCNDDIRNVPEALWKHEGKSPTTAWTFVSIAGGGSDRIGIFGVDPADARRLYVSSICAPGCAGMRRSGDGGSTWTVDHALNDRMTGKGLIAPGADTFDMINHGGPDGAYGFRAFPFGGYIQPSLVAFDPADPEIIAAGGKDSGLFLSTDGGKSWGLLTNPVHPTPFRPHIPQPWFAHFAHDATGTVNLYVGTRGRGVWRIAIRKPVADIGGPYSTIEGTDITLDASGSTDPDGQPLSFEWDLDGDGVFETPSGSSAVFDLVGQDGVYKVGVRATAGGVSSVDTTTVTVANVPPSVTATSDSPQDENSPITVSGVVSDPGWLDPLTATIDWGDGSGPMPLTGTYEGNRPDATLSFSVSHVYGDNGSFTATICGMDDDSVSCLPMTLGVDNVPPTAVIDTSGAVPVNGIPTFVTHAGDPIDFGGESTDPGSDDLTLSWDWDDGPPAPDVTTLDLVNPPNPDPLPSPSIQPRDVFDAKTHAFAQACLYDVVFSSEDDDGGMGSDTAAVVITGNADLMRSPGYWQHQMETGGFDGLDAATLQCYLDIAGFMSQVFDEVRDASTPANALIVLDSEKAATSMRKALDRQILAAWLNFANGAIDLDDGVSTDKDKALETTFAKAMAAAEAVRLDPNASRYALEEQKEILERINTKSK